MSLLELAPRMQITHWFELSSIILVWIGISVISALDFAFGFWKSNVSSQTSCTCCLLYSWHLVAFRLLQAWIHVTCPFCWHWCPRPNFFMLQLLHYFRWKWEDRYLVLKPHGWGSPGNDVASPYQQWTRDNIGISNNGMVCFVSNRQCIDSMRTNMVLAIWNGSQT